MKSSIISNYRFGWKPDPEDERDFKLPRLEAPKPLHSVYLFDRFNTPPVYDQGELGSCVGQGVASLVQFELMNKLNHPQNPNASLFYPSALFIYYYAREIDGNVYVDSGTSIRNGIKAVAKQGVPSVEKWAYDIYKFDQEPTQDAKDQALKFSNFTYYRVNSTRQGLVEALDRGSPIVFGFDVYDSFITIEVSKTGVVPMPKSFEHVIGGHCAVIWAYNAEKDYFLIRNSWGPYWGTNGYFKMPAKYITNPNMAQDFWAIRAHE